MPPRFTQDGPPAPEPTPPLAPQSVPPATPWPSAAAQPPASPSLPSSPPPTPAIIPVPVPNPVKNPVKPRRKVVPLAPPVFGQPAPPLAESGASPLPPIGVPSVAPGTGTKPKTTAVPAMPTLPGAPPVFGAPANYARVAQASRAVQAAQQGTVLPAPSMTLPPPQRVLRPRARPAAPARKPSPLGIFKNKKVVVFGGGALSALLLVGFFLWYGPASAPQAVFSAAINNTMDVKTYRQTFTLDRKIGNSRIAATYVVDVNATNVEHPVAKGTMEVNQVADDVISVRKGEFVLDGNKAQYIKLTDFSDENISGTNKGIDKDNLTLLEQVKDKWLITDEASSDLPLSTLIMLNPMQLANLNSVNGLLLYGNIDDAKQRQLNDFNRANNVYRMVTSRTMSFQGYETYRYDVNLQRVKLQEYNQLFNKQLISSTLLSSLDAFTLFVDTGSRLPMRIEAQQDGGDLRLVIDYMNYNKEIDIEAPADAVPLEEAVPGLDGDDSGGSLDIEGAQ